MIVGVLIAGVPIVVEMLVRANRNNTAPFVLYL
jgi:hypothetical protein